MYPNVQANMPKFSTRNALVVLNMQNDSFEKRHDMVLCEHQEFRHALTKLIPYFRSFGDVVWVKTEVAMAAGSPPSSDGQRDSRPQSRSSRSSPGSPETSPRRINTETISSYFPSSRAKASMRKADSQAISEARRAEIEAWNMDEDQDVKQKPRKAAPSDMLFLPGTRGVELPADMLKNVDLKNDLVITKNYYSAFDNTPLLISLRMKLVTHIYLSGCLSNVSIYATAADAVRHGFDVTVIEDCLGYRSHTKHVEAMQKMADLLGVSGIDSNEIIDKVTGSTTDRPYSRSRGSPKAGHPDAFSSESNDNWSDGASPRRPGTAPLGATAQDSVRSRSPLTPTSPVDALQMEGLEMQKSFSKPGKNHLGPDDDIGEGDSTIILDALSAFLADHAFKQVHEEVDWQVMRHRNGEVPRRVAVQGETGYGGAVPLYRHPADESPPFLDFTPTIKRIRDELQILLKQPFNHCLIQLYRNGQDNISEHSDKTLDIVRGSSIVNLSLGARRTMTLRSKKEAHAEARNIQRIFMPHNSVFVLGSRTNAKWLHGVRADKRLLSEKSEEERAYAGQRISLTFRNIGTFTNRPRTRIWGQGAKSKIEATAGQVITAKNADMEAMITAFGMENRLTNFDWDAEYGKGFDVLNLVITETQTIATVRLCVNEVSNLRVKMAVMSRAIPCRFMKAQAWNLEQKGGIQGGPTGAPISKKRSIFALSESENPVFRDTDPEQPELVGDMAVFEHINRVYTAEPDPKLSPKAEHRLHQNVFKKFTRSDELLVLWQELRGGLPFNSSTRMTRMRRFNLEEMDTNEAAAAEMTNLPAIFEAEIELVEESAGDATYIAGEIFTLGDCAFWPVLNEIVRRWEGWSEKRYPNLAIYWKKVGAMQLTRRAMLERGEDSARDGFSSRGIISLV